MASMHKRSCSPPLDMLNVSPREAESQLPAHSTWFQLAGSS